MERTETPFKVAGYDVTVAETPDAESGTTCELQILGHGLDPTNITYRINKLLKANGYNVTHQWHHDARILTYESRGIIENGRPLDAVTAKAIGDAIKSIRSTVSLSDLRFEETAVTDPNGEGIVGWHVRSYLPGADPNKVDKLLVELNHGLKAMGSNKQFEAVKSESQGYYVLQEIQEYKSNERLLAQESADLCNKMFNKNLLETEKGEPSAALDMQITRKRFKGDSQQQH